MDFYPSKANVIIILEWWFTYFLECSRIIYKAPHSKVDAYIGSHMSSFMINLIYTKFYILCTSMLRWIKWLFLPPTFCVSFIFLALYYLLFPPLLHKQFHIQASNTIIFMVLMGASHRWSHVCLLSTSNIDFCTLIYADYKALETFLDYPVKSIRNRGWASDPIFLL